MTSIDQAAKAPFGESFARLLTDPARLKLVARCWIVVAAVAYIVDLLHQTSAGLTNGIGRPLGEDFINYWSGAFLALHGRAAEVYNFLAFHAFEVSVAGPDLDLYHYSYPPVLLVLTAPLAAIPYVPALGVWLAATWYGFYRALRLTGSEGALLLSLATPALFANAYTGQNGALTAALLGGGLMLVDRRPVVAGMLFGLLAYKPQLALMLPVALIAGRRWSTVVAAGATVALLIAVSVVAFGAERWLEYQHNLSILREVVLERGIGLDFRFMSVFVAARHLGASVAVAYALQGGCALLAVYFVARSWLRDDPACIRNAMVVVGTCLLTPYLQDYDLVVVAFVVVWLQTAGTRSAIPAYWTTAAMAAILLLPIVAGAITKGLGFLPGPFVFAFVFVLLVALAREHRGTVAGPVARLGQA